MSGYSADVGAWSSWFQAAKARVTDLKPAHEAIGEYVKAEFQANLDGSKGVDGTFKPLAPATLTAKRLKYGSTPLVKTRKMRNGIRYVVGATFCDIGSGYRQSRRVMFGFPEGKTPARNPMFLTDSNKARINDIYARHIIGVH